MRITRSSPSSAARRGDGLGLEIGEDVVLDDGQVVLLRRASARRCAVCGESVAPVGLWSAELVM